MPNATPPLPRRWSTILAPRALVSPGILRAPRLITHRADRLPPYRRDPARRAPVAPGSVLSDGIEEPDGPACSCLRHSLAAIPVHRT